MIEVNYNEYKETIAQNMKLIVENHDLKEEIERLQQRIDKAIEYLNNECLYDEEMKCYCDDLFCGNVKELVDILKGVDKPRKGEVVSLEELESYEPKNSVEEEYYDEMWS